MKEIDIHNMAQKFKSIEKKFKECKEINIENKALVIEFARNCFSEGLSTTRVAKYYVLMKRICIELGKEKMLQEVTKEDVQDLMIRIQERYTSDWTINDHRIALKKFFKWLRKGEQYPPEVSWLKTGIKIHRHKLPEELLTEEEIKLMLEHCSCERDRALLSLLYETGARVSEIGGLKLKHVVFENSFCKVLLFGKTGARRIPVFTSKPYITKWLDVHPDKKNSDSPLFTKRVKGNYIKTHVTYSTIRALLIRIAKASGITKPVNPHNFRHSRATKLASDFTESQLKQYMGWTQDSGMASVYVHLNGKHLEEAVKKLYGLKTEEKDSSESVLKPVECMVCKISNESIANFCQRCGNPLTEKQGISVQQRLDTLKKDDEATLLALQQGMGKMFERLEELEKSKK